MHGIFTYNWAIFGVNVGKYSSTMVRIWVLLSEHQRLQLQEIRVPGFEASEALRRGGGEQAPAPGTWISDRCFSGPKRRWTQTMPISKISKGLRVIEIARFCNRLFGCSISFH